MPTEPPRLVPIVAACLALTCGGAQAPGRAGNVLILILDDVGTDKVGAYHEPHPPPTPNIDALAARGLRFSAAYSAPMCSPSRAALLTGRYPRRYGLGAIVHTSRDDFELPLEEVTLPEILAQSAASYSSSAVGKWHLAGRSSPSGLLHPLRSGFGWYAGSFGNLEQAGGVAPEAGPPLGYYHWQKNDNGRLYFTETYATTDSVDDAVERMARMPEPWLLWVAFNAAHSPWEAPPAALHTRSHLDTPADRYDATVEALDREIGRLLDALGPERQARTTIFLLGDNGTPVAAQRPPRPFGQHKGSLYEAGVHVPFIVAGPDVARPGAECLALVHLVDVLPTVAQLAHLDPAQLRGSDGSPLRLDGYSLLPQLRDPSLPARRAFVFQDHFRPNGFGPYAMEERMLRDTRYKLVETRAGETFFYDFEAGGDAVALRPSQLPAAQRRTFEQMRQVLADSVREIDRDRARPSTRIDADRARPSTRIDADRARP